MAGDRRLDRRTGAAERHAGGVEFELLLEQFGRELRRGADAGIGDRGLARVGFDVVNQLFDRFNRHVRMNNHDVRRGRG
jgi:hypothetical protein